MQTYFKPRDPRVGKDLINTFNRGWPGIFFPMTSDNTVTSRFRHLRKVDMSSLLFYVQTPDWIKYFLKQLKEYKNR